MDPLQLIHAATARPPVAQVRFKALLLPSGTRPRLEARFEVICPEISVNPDLSRESSQWGLWDWDVVELFLQVREADPTYYEFQVSPLGQFFELEIFEPRKRFNREFVSGFNHERSPFKGGRWTARMEIPLEKLDWDGKLSSLKGNAYAILGDPSRRSHWGLHAPAGAPLAPEQQPDFHRPENFRPLLTGLT